MESSSSLIFFFFRFLFRGSQISFLSHSILTRIFSHSSATVEREDTHKTVDSTVPGVGDSDHNTDAAMTDSEREEPSTKKLSSSETENVVSKPQQTITAAKSDDHQNEGSDIQPTVSKDTETLRRRVKHFTTFYNCNIILTVKPGDAFPSLTD